MPELPSSISLVMRSYNEGHYLRETLESVSRQAFKPKIKLIVIDSGSTDGSHEIIRAFKPAEFIIIDRYVPGEVLNQGARLADTDWIVYLNADATPADDQWLGALLSAATSAHNPGAFFSRQVPRPDCQAVYAHDYERCFGPQRESVRWDHFFSMVSCVVNRAAWEAEPFREDLQYAEDDEWSRRLLVAGYAVGFAEQSRVIHSHNYTLAQARKRAYGDALAVAKAGNVPDIRRRWWRDVLLAATKETLRDATYCLTHGKAFQIPHAFAVRIQQRRGRLQGYRDGLASLQNG